MGRIKAYLHIIGIGILCIMLTACGAKKDPEVEHVQNLISELPRVEDVQTLTIEEQAEVYNNKLILAGEAFETLNEEQKKQIDRTPMDELNGYFNTLIEPIELQ